MITRTLPSGSYPWRCYEARPKTSGWGIYDPRAGAFVEFVTYSTREAADNAARGMNRIYAAWQPPAEPQTGDLLHGTIHVYRVVAHRS